MSLSNKFSKAIRHPEKIPPYFQRQISHASARVTDARRQLATRRATRGLPAQKERLDELRTGDSWLLIVLDACRYQELSRFAPRVFEGTTERIATAGHDTFEYARLCWPDNYPDVTYVSGAVPINSNRVHSNDQGGPELYGGYHPVEHIGTIVDAWQTEWDESLGIAPPWRINEVAMEYLTSPQLVVHYFQPHAPYIGVERELGHADDEDALPESGEAIDAPIWRKIKQGKISDSRLHDLYTANLEAALASLGKLIEASDHDRIVVTGDHGEALGEYDTYAHPRVEHPKIRVVPWIEVAGLRNDWREAVRAPKPKSNADQSGIDGDVEARLAELGYL